MPLRHDLHPDDPGLSLALAMVVSSAAPLLLIDRELKIIVASASFCIAFDLDPASVSGHPFSELGAGEWNSPHLRSLIDAVASGDAQIDAYEMDLERKGQPARRVVVNVQKLAYDDKERIRLLVAIADVTEARLSEKKDRQLGRENEAKARELAAENDALLQEIRHRVANSLQIIASVLMQNARNAQSDEARTHLHDARKRVLSISDLQQQLAGATTGAVKLRIYLTKLCATIAASMIPDPEALALEVVAEDVTIDAGASVSMGLIVTELVINALKHAFPNDRPGRIVVDYQVDGPMWALSVSDTGVGMPAEPTHVALGRGTSIVQALSRQLQARVDVDQMNPGTKVSIVHTPVAPIATDPAVREAAV